MGCGCGGGGKTTRNVKAPTLGVVASANIGTKHLNPAEKVVQERKIIDKIRRDNVLNALRRP